eukprot:3367174-Prymnesium_polylepis.1
MARGWGDQRFRGEPAGVCTAVRAQGWHMQSRPPLAAPNAEKPRRRRAPAAELAGLGRKSEHSRCVFALRLYSHGSRAWRLLLLTSRLNTLTDHRDHTSQIERNPSRRNK